MGMLATVMNGLALQDTLEALGVRDAAAERRADGDGGRAVHPPPGACGTWRRAASSSWPGGTGNPFVTTDTAAALRGTELDADVLLKATRVDGVYSDDPEKNPYAEKFDRLTFDQVIQKQLGVMDIGAFEMCRLAKLPILVFNYKQDGAIERAIAGHPIGTVVSG